MLRTNRSLVWNYFQAQSNEAAQCSVCLKVIRRTHCSTSSMKYHLNSVHGLTLEPSPSTPSSMDGQSPAHGDLADLPLHTPDHWLQNDPLDAAQSTAPSSIDPNPSQFRGGELAARKLEKTWSGSPPDSGPGRVNRSKVWDHYVPLNTEEAMCKYCQKIMMRRNASTSSMKYHLRSKHKIKFDGTTESENGGQPPVIEGIKSPASAMATPAGPSRRSAIRLPGKEEVFEDESSVSQDASWNPGQTQARLPRRNRSEVWDHFHVLTEHAAICVVCQKVVRRINSSATGNLRYHLRTQHDIIIQGRSGRDRESGLQRKRQRNHSSDDFEVDDDADESPEEDDEDHDEKPGPARQVFSGRRGPGRPPKNQAYLVEDLVESMISEESVDEVLAKLVAVDGFTMRSLLKSEFMAEALAAKNIPVPANLTQFSDLLIAHARQLCEKAADELANLADGGLRFSLTLDHWRSSHHKSRSSQLYTNVRCHSTGMSWSLGIVPREKASEPLALSALKARLTDFGLNPQRDIVGSTSHEPLQLGVTNQRCVAHGILQAITSVLYTPDNDLSDSEKSDLEEDSSDEEEEENEERPRLVLVPSIRSTVKQLIESNVLQIIESDVQTFPTDELQRPLTLGPRLRWTKVLTTFNAILSSLKKSAQHGDILSETEKQNVEHIVNTLQPLHMGLESFCGKDATLLSAEGIYVFMLRALKKVNTSLAEQLRLAVLDCIAERRQNDVVSLLKYLNNPESLKETVQFSFQKMPSRANLERVAFRMGRQLFPDTFKESDVEAIGEEDMDLSAELNRSIADATASSRPSNPFVRDLMDLFELTGELPPALQVLRDALLTIPPTCVQSNRCQRAFSTKCGTNHFGSKLPFKVLDALIFLKGYYDQRE